MRSETNIGCRRIALDGRAVPVQDGALALELLDRTTGKVPDRGMVGHYAQR
jgi:hypothetical protein